MLFKIKRIQKGITQAQLSILSGVSLKTIRNIEQGKVNPSTLCIKKLVRILDNISEQEIFDYIMESHKKL